MTKHKKTCKRMRGGNHLSKTKFNEIMNAFFLEKEKDVDEEQIDRLFEYYKRNHNIEKLKKSLSMSFNLAPNLTVEEILNEWDNMEDTSFLSEGFSSDVNINDDPFPSFTPTSEVSSHASSSHNLGMGIKMKKRMTKKNKSNKKSKSRTYRKNKKNHRKKGGGTSYTCDQDKNQLNFKQSE
jgi:hypothetical protein